MRKSYLNKIKANISIYARKNSSSLLDGSYRSIFKGKSLNFDDLREYVVGDNVRDIDWKASSRSRKLLVKQYVAERRHNIMLILDTDRKMLADSKDNDAKKDIALMTAGTIAYLCSKTGDAIGSIYNRDNVMEFFPLKSDTYSIEKLLAKYDRDMNNENNSDINKTLNYIRNNINRSMIIFIITDLAGLESIDEVYFRELSMRHDIMLINISDGYLFGKDVYDLDTDTYIPNIFSKNQQLFQLENEYKDNLYISCLNKISKYRVSIVTIDNIEEIPIKVIKLLEDYKYANRH
ncbi:MAG: DUF58 domain-containing protein [Bacilli bacterium]|nr:DUF58 domain-containing protein [Bacilli bacterium]